MKTIQNALQPVGWMAVVTLMMCFWTGCDTGSSAMDEPLDPAGASLLAEMDFVESVEMTVLNPGSAKDEQLILHVQMDETARIRYPEAFHILGMRNDGSVARMEDNGLGADAVAGDGLYSAQVDRSCLEDGSLPEAAGKDILEFTLSCDVNFIAPGSECAGEGVCPETDSRSFLWGLIEYDVDVVTCWCFQGCTAEFKVSLGKDDTSMIHPPALL